MHDLDYLTDEELTSLLQEGDHAAFTQIYQRYKGLLVIHASKKLAGNLEDAKEIVQEIFLNLWNNRFNIPVIQNLRAYLYTIIRNRILNYIAHQGIASRYAASFSQFASKHSCTTDERIRERQMMAIIEQEIEALPPKMRAVFILSRKQHQSYREIAETLNVSEHTVKNHIKSALKILHKKLDIMVFIMLLTRY